MKTLIITFATALSLVAAAPKTSNAATKNVESTTLTDVKNISKIEVRGNVELYVSDGADDNVKVYNKYYSENAFVQNQNGVLRIASYKAEKLVIWVTAKDLRAIAAYDNAEVKSFGKMSAINLDVNLYNNASADLNLNAYAATITVNDKASANLSGEVNNCDLKYAQSASVNASKFAAVNFNRTIDRAGFEKKANEQIAGIE